MLPCAYKPAYLAYASSHLHPILDSRQPWGNPYQGMLIIVIYTSCAYATLGCCMTDPNASIVAYPFLLLFELHPICSLPWRCELCHGSPSTILFCLITFEFLDLSKSRGELIVRILHCNVVRTPPELVERHANMLVVNKCVVFSEAHTPLESSCTPLSTAFHTCTIVFMPETGSKFRATALPSREPPSTLSYAAPLGVPTLGHNAKVLSISVTHRAYTEL
jgi:hypothetical protein